MRASTSLHVRWQHPLTCLLAPLQAVGGLVLVSPIRWQAPSTHEWYRQFCVWVYYRNAECFDSLRITLTRTNINGDTLRRCISAGNLSLAAVTGRVPEVEFGQAGESRWQRNI